MTTTKAIIISVISAIVITALGLVAFVGLQASSNGVKLGAQIQNDVFWFYNGIKVGTTGQFTVSNTGQISNGSVPFIIPTGSSQAPFPTILVGNFDQGTNGWSAPSPISTSTTITPTQFCQTASQIFQNTTALATETLPAATSTWLACGSPAFGAWSTQIIVNNSTNTVNIVAGTGSTFQCETQGVGTTTIVGGCTATQISIPATSTVAVFGYWITSSTQYIDWGNMYH